MITGKAYSPLGPWLGRTDSLSSFVDLSSRKPSEELGGFIALDISLPIHESIDLAAQSLAQAWRDTSDYVNQALEIIHSDKPLWLDREEVQMIKEQLGQPPTHCYPIYIFSVGSDKEERPVYIGKTSSENGRFSGGHLACTKLHNPKYDGLQKRLYLGCVMLLDEGQEYLPLEWVHPYEDAEQLLRDIEAQLIYHFKPELNTLLKKKPIAKFRTQIHLQNMSGFSDFLNDVFV
jgi:hypothetical protein